MSDTDPLDLLRAADPSPEHSTPEPRTTPEVLFEQITTNTTATDHASVDSHSPRSSRRWRPTVAMPAAAAVVAIVVGGAVLVQPGKTPPASALVAEAAATSAGFEAGRVAVTVDIVELPDDDTTGSFMLDYRFDDGDFALSFETSVFEELSGEDDVEIGDIDIRGIGDELFSSFEESASFVVSPRSEETESIEALFGFQPTSMEPGTVVALLEQTDDFEAVTTDDGTAIYRGSVKVATLEELGAGSLPAGLTLLADPDTPNDDLPDTLGVDVVVTDGLLDTLTIEIDGESELGYTKGTITTTFSEYGEPQDIVAPPADQISDEAAAFPGGMPEGFEEALAVLEEMESRRPGLCSEIFGDLDPELEALDDELIAQLEEFPACLEAAGEQEAADAFRSLNQFVD